MIYIACPSGIATGGTELLHQLCFELQKYTPNVRMFYIGMQTEVVIPKRFLTYEPQWCTEVIDNERNILIFPEIYTNFRKKYKNINLVCWWLSVDSYLFFVNDRRPKLLRKPLWLLSKLYEDRIFRDKRVIHLSQCQYIHDFLHQKGCACVSYLSDYINAEYLIESAGDIRKERDDIVLYNPKKGLEFTNRIIKAAPGIKFRAIDGLAINELISTFESSKVYIDFGNHPGKDRLPREAALMGVAVIAGLRGSARNDTDVPIPSDCKFECREDEIPNIVNKIYDMFREFESQTKRYDAYRERIRNEYSVFCGDVKKVFELHLAVHAVAN